MSTITTDITAVVDGHLGAYGEPDPVVRAQRVAALWSPDGRVVDPPVTGEGHQGIAALGDALQAHFPGHRFRRAGDIDAHHDFVRYAWELIAPDGQIALTGLDVAELAPDGRLRRIVGFFDEPR